MPLAFSTLGCPGMKLSSVVEIAMDQGYHGLELRAGPDEPVHTGLDGAQRQVVSRQLGAASITALSVASYVRICDPDVDDDVVVSAGLGHARLAYDIGARYLRVFPGGRRPRPATNADDQRGARRLARIIEGCQGLGVSVALETHDSHHRAADVRRIIDQPGCAEATVVWDVLHTWLGAEDPSDSLDLLSGRLAYVQIKDVVSRADLTPRPPAAGALPLAEVAAAVRDRGYDGWISWEYERAWHPSEPPLATLAAGVRRWVQSQGLLPRSAH
ncbi:sugar phosphate isomerase/epimerase [Micromonospora sp. DR5-3]|uniref:sugar phosphate isomerase/epimerase family protein n=1 Tax=unclassified Micromonospora TaxID=2617518 RepID=UPI0011D3A783|nr:MULTISPECIES: sugar phosphate isomerase/epimerase [unclassified Micromonospora]MCW3815970.1 sugar phosphate isomerase/epimerase [Micromonospora sp. DR5-3]TYC20838.1 sugar phosphate isomerase/epimerase [Micromonospora sp. MP36]